MTEDRGRDPDNPYSPPSVDDLAWTRAAEPAPVPVQEERPKSGPTSLPKVFGILSICFASIVLLAGLMQSCGWAAAQGMSKAAEIAPAVDGEEGLKKQLKGVEHMVAVYNGLGLQGVILTVMSVWLLVIGVGQLRYRRWACKQTVLWGWTSFAALAAVVAISFLMVGPAYQRFFEAQAQVRAPLPAGAHPGLMSLIYGGSFGVSYLVALAPYPILTLLFFSKARIRAAMSR